MSRLNDTVSLVKNGTTSMGRRTTSVRKIDNGYLHEDSYYNEKTGQYECSEQFSTSPNMEVKKSSVGDEGLSDVKRYLGKDV